MHRTSDFVTDTSVLNMLTMEWSTIPLAGYPLKGIYGFASCPPANDELYIFGGNVEPYEQSQQLLKLSVKRGQLPQKDKLMEFF